MKKSLLLLAWLTSVAVRAQVVTVTNGTATSASAPLSYGQPYSANEAVYLANQINTTGPITRLAFDKVEGSVVAPIENVVIYMKNTTASDFAAGTLDTTSYQRVFAGNYPNNLVSGYLEVPLRAPFAYTAGSNLAVLVLRNGGPTNATTGQQPKFRYGFTTGRNSTRRYTGTTALTSTTALIVSTALANVRLTFGTVSASRTVTAGPSHRLYPLPATHSVTLDATGLTGPLSYFITDEVGRVVQPTTRLSAAVNGQHQLNISGLRGGAYHVHLASPTQREVVRLLRE